MGVVNEGVVLTVRIAIKGISGDDENDAKTKALVKLKRDFREYNTPDIEILEVSQIHRGYRKNPR